MIHFWTWNPISTIIVPHVDSMLIPTFLLLKWSLYLACNSLTILSLCVAFIDLLGVYSASLIYRLIFFSSYKKCPATIYAFSPFTFFPFWDSNDTHIRLRYCPADPQIPECLKILFCFLCALVSMIYIFLSS